MKNDITEFKQDLADNKRGGDRADKFKSTVFGIGMAYENCGYGQYAGRKYKCYILDLEDNKVKMTDFSYTTGKKIAALSEGARTKFEGFPMPYVVNLKTDKAGTKEVNTDVLADEDYTLTPEVENELVTFSSIQEVIDNLKKWQKKQVEENPEMQDKVKAFIAKKEQEEVERKAKANKDIPTVQTDPDYPQEEINADEIPF